MNRPPQSSTTRSHLDARFRRGLRCFEVDDWTCALAYFREVDQQADPDDPRSNLYTAYHGLARVYLGDKSGLRLCRQAAAYEEEQAIVFFNLAQAEQACRHRRQAYHALCRGLHIEPQHRGLLRLRKSMGTRRKPVLRFLRREHPLNRWLGKLTWRLLRSRSLVAQPH